MIEIQKINGYFQCNCCSSVVNFCPVYSAKLKIRCGHFARLYGFQKHLIAQVSWIVVVGAVPSPRVEVFFLP